MCYERMMTGMMESVVQYCHHHCLARGFSCTVCGLAKHKGNVGVGLSSADETVIGYKVPSMMVALGACKVLVSWRRRICPNCNEKQITLCLTIGGVSQHSLKKLVASSLVTLFHVPECCTSCLET